MLAGPNESARKRDITATVSAIPVAYANHALGLTKSFALRFCKSPLASVMHIALVKVTTQAMARTRKLENCPLRVENFTNKVVNE